MRFDIIYSVTAHEQIDCVKNLYDNIMKFHKDKRVLVIFNINTALRRALEYRDYEFDNLIFNEKVSDKKKYTCDILIAHLENFDVVKNFDFDLFCTLASNCLFVKEPDWHAIYRDTPKLNVTRGDFKIPDYSKNLWDRFLLDTPIVDVFKSEGVEPQMLLHEGAYFKKEVFNYIYYFCILNKIKKSSFVNDEVPQEEVILPSLEKLSTGEVSKRYCGLIPDITEMDLLRIIQTGGCPSLKGNHYNIVKVQRDMNNPLRKIINQL